MTAATTPIPATSSSVGTLIYFNFRARGEPIRLVAAYAGLILSQNVFKMSEWGRIKRSMPKGQVPVLRLPDGALMPEMNDICKYLALLPSPEGRQLVVDAKQDSIIRKVNGALLHSVSHMTNLHPIAHALQQSDYVREKATRFLQQFIDLLGAENFFGGAAPGYGELGLWLLVEDCMLLVPDLLDQQNAGYDRFKQWYARVADLPGISEFLASRPQVGEGNTVRLGASCIVEINDAP
eukprot:CAMPEP_0194322688 /NCGR_PEP_ID=MMETSP0171-20130528/22217_1 /TAXON_ID=218684 /ORGANISM="Corethron pennatum, Strain L29A3" /LENGTH=236 /DNA_ID=CAMNT_0039081039 /DNA_START=56 /DNA_END=763 /DNA_ORIENTATION=-